MTRAVDEAKVGLKRALGSTPGLRKGPQRLIRQQRQGELPDELVFRDFPAKLVSYRALGLCLVWLFRVAPFFLDVVRFCLLCLVVCWCVGFLGWSIVFLVVFVAWAVP